MRHILELVRPTLVYSFAYGGEVGRYYDVHKISNMRHELTILAYEMNGAPVSVLHGAPLRLGCENELGFKMVKWIAAIEFVHDFTDLGAVGADTTKTVNSTVTGWRSERSAEAYRWTAPLQVGHLRLH